jgi:hypothetical protein
MLSLTPSMLKYFEVKPVLEGLRIGHRSGQVYFFIETTSGEVVSSEGDLARDLAANRPDLMKYSRVREALRAAGANLAMDFYNSLS